MTDTQIHAMKNWNNETISFKEALLRSSMRGYSLEQHEKLQIEERLFLSVPSLYLWQIVDSQHETDGIQDIGFATTIQASNGIE